MQLTEKDPFSSFGMVSGGVTVAMGVRVLGNSVVQDLAGALTRSARRVRVRRKSADSQTHKAMRRTCAAILGVVAADKKEQTRPRGYKRILAWILKGMANISIIEEAIIPGANQQYLDAAFWEERYAAEGELKKSTREWLGDYSIFAEHFRRHVSDKGASILILGQ